MRSDFNVNISLYSVFFFFLLSILFLIRVPVHVFPLPVYPGLQEQRYEPIVLVHSAFM